MHDVNGWLMVLSFVLGLLLTFALLIRRVVREVPVAAGAGRAAVEAPTAGLTTGSVEAPTAELAIGGTPDAATETINLATAAGPYGAGSAKAGAGGSGPAGWTIKGNEDSMLYHTLDSPSYKQTIAEVWFREERAAQAAGFTRWDAHKASGSAAKVAGGTPDAATETINLATAGEPYGAGSAKAGAGGSGPAGWTIKGNEDSMLYHTPDSPWYKQTIAEVWFREERAAQAAGFTRWDVHKASGGDSATEVIKLADVPPGPYGAGSAKAGAGGSGPAGWTIKGNEDSMLYHTLDSPAYDATIAEVWFNDEQVAKAAGFARWDSWKKK